MSFWLLTAMLAALAVVFVIWPLFFAKQDIQANDAAKDDNRRDLLLDLFNDRRQELNVQLEQGALAQSEYDALLEELEQALVNDSEATVKRRFVSQGWVLPVGGLLVVMGSYLFYQFYGAIDEVDIQLLLEERYQNQMGAMRDGDEIDPTISAALQAKLAGVVERHPDSEQNRYLLARLSAEIGEYGDAVKHYTYLLQYSEDIDVNPQPKARFMAELAQVVFLASGNQITPEVSVLAQKSLELDARETTALGLAGIEAFDQSDFHGAISFWRRAVTVLGANSPVGQGLMAGIARAQAKLGDGQAVADSSSEPLKGGLSVAVSLAEGVVVESTAVVFVYARAWDGSKMPLAIQRFPVSELPKVVVLDKSSAMAPGMDIYSVAKLELVARISKSGAAKPVAGDWLVETGPVVLQAETQALSLVIEKQLP